jgi:hypothetical protein
LVGAQAKIGEDSIDRATTGVRENFIQLGEVGVEETNGTRALLDARCGVLEIARINIQADQDTFTIQLLRYGECMTPAARGAINEDAAVLWLERLDDLLK